MRRIIAKRCPLPNIYAVGILSCSSSLRNAGTLWFGFVPYSVDPTAVCARDLTCVLCFGYSP